MGWETRKQRAYYYEKQREPDGRVRSIYRGPLDGPGSLAAALDRAKRTERDEQWAALASGRAAHKSAERAVADLAREVDGLAVLLLLDAGYHRHKRQWRLCRKESMKAPSERLLQQQAQVEVERRKAIRAALPPLPEPGDFSPEARASIQRRCDAYPTAEDRQALRALLAHDPSLKRMGNIVQAALWDAIKPPGAEKITGQEYTRAWLNERRAALGYDSRRPLETVLIDHLLLCEVRLGQLELGYTEITNKGDTRRLELSDRALTNAQTRYLRAVETLAKLRRVRVEVFASAGADGSRSAGMAVEA